MSSNGLPRPYVVAAFFADGTGMTMNSVSLQMASSTDNAATAVVSKYYLSGGKLPLISTSVFQVTREQCGVGLKLLDEIDAADKAEQEKVVNLVPAPPPADVEMIPAEPPAGAA